MSDLRKTATPRPEPEKERAEVAPTARGVGQLEEIDSVTSEVYHAPPEDIDALRRDAERYRARGEVPK